MSSDGWKWSLDDPHYVKALSRPRTFEANFVVKCSCGREIAAVFVSPHATVHAHIRILCQACGVASVIGEPLPGYAKVVRT